MEVKHLDRETSFFNIIANKSRILLEDGAYFNNLGLMCGAYLGTVLIQLNMVTDKRQVNLRPRTPYF